MSKNSDEDKTIKELQIQYEKYCEELKELIDKDYPIPVLKERYFFMESKIKRVLDEIIIIKENVEVSA